MARVLFFGRLGDIAGGRARDWKIESETATITDLVAALASHDAALGEALSAASVRCAVNEIVTGRDAPISDEDEIAFLPPVSGG
ncbi:MAG: MoaD/ThiS family protein [Parvularculaceae bacterium]